MPHDRRRLGTREPPERQKRHLTRTISVKADPLTHYGQAGVRKSWWDDEAHVVTGEDVVLDELQTTFGQVRSRQRVIDLAEVFTHQREVDAILDIIPAGFDDPTWKYLEPAAGNGNFLVEILRRKLSRVSKADHTSLHDYANMLRGIFGTSATPSRTHPEPVVSQRGGCARSVLDAVVRAPSPTPGTLSPATSRPHQLSATPGQLR